MAVRSTILSNGDQGTRTIIADNLSDVPASGSFLGDVLDELSTGYQYTLRQDVFGTKFWSDGSNANIQPPNSPILYVSNSGSDVPSQTGSAASPLATVQEAARRHRANGATGFPVIRLVDTISLGASPTLDMSSTSGGGLLVLQTTYAIDVAGIAPTGGTTGNFVTSTAGTFTSADGSAIHTQKGKILHVVGGTNSLLNTRYVIDDNDGAGGFTPAAYLGTAPVAGNTFNIESRTGKLTWSGQFTVTGDVFYVDGVDYIPTQANAEFLLVGAVMLEVATRWTAPSAGRFRLESEGGDWQSSPVKDFVVFTPLTATAKSNLPLPPNVSLCGCRYDGTAAALSIGGNLFLGLIPGDSNWWFEMSSMEGVDIEQGDILSAIGKLGVSASFLTTCGAVCVGAGNKLILWSVRITNGRSVTGGGSLGTGVCSFTLGASGVCQLLAFTTPAVGNDLVSADLAAFVSMNTVSGAAAAAGKLAVKVSNGATVRSQGNSCTGGTGTQDVAVDGGTAFPIADANTMLIVGAQNGTFQHSTSDLTANPTINKFSGFAAVQVGATTCTIANSLADVGDHVDITPTSINAAVAKYSAVATLNTITVTTDAAATVAPWSFSFNLRKSTV